MVARVAVVLFLITAQSEPQILDSPDTIFPSDSRDPQLVDGARLLETVCPGKVVSGKEIGCDIDCPKYTAFAGERFEWSLAAVTFGHFQSSRSDDAALWMVGCEPHSLNWGGTILLTRSSGQWSMLWYKGGIPTARCHRIPVADGREILVCIGGYGGQGIAAADLYVEDLLHPKPALMAGDENDAGFFGAFDDTGTCGWQQETDEPDSATVTHTHIDRVRFHAAVGRNGSPSISVTASFGTRMVNRADIDACIHKRRRLAVATRSYRMNFFFEGHGFRASPSSVAAVRIFNRSK